MYPSREITREELLSLGCTEGHLDALETEGAWYHNVDVVESCDCSACEQNQKWFMCRRLKKNYIKSYLVPGRDYPRSDEIEKIKRDHPGKELIYLCAPGCPQCREGGKR